MLLKKVLEDPNTNVNLRIGLGSTPLLAAVGSADVGVVGMLLERADMDVNCQTTICNHNPLHVSLENQLSSSSAVVGLLAKHPGIDLELKNCHRLTVIEAAFKAKNLDAVITLVKSKPSLDPGAILRLMFLNRDCINSASAKTLLKQLLADERANVNQVIYPVAMKPLQIAAGSGNRAIVQTLLARPDLDVNCTSPGCQISPLYLAIESEQPTSDALLRLLINDSRIDLESRNNIGETVLEAAVRRRRFDAVSTLMESGGSLHPSNILHSMLLQTPIDDLHGLSAKMLLRKLLADTRTDVNRPVNRFGYTPLNVAVNLGDVTIVDLLLERPDLDVNCKALYCQSTPLHMALGNQHPGCDNVVRPLLDDPRTDLECINRRGENVLDYAKMHGTEVQAMLVKFGCERRRKEEGKANKGFNGRFRALRDRLSSIMKP